MKRNFLLIVCLVASALLYAQTGKNIELNLVYIGNSITQGALLKTPEQDAPPVQASLWLQKQKDVATVEYSNQGISGHTTLDFLPVSKTAFPKVTQAADLLREKSHGMLLFSMMLGTNDSAVKGPNGSPVSPQQYYTNMKAIIDELISLYPSCTVVVHAPVWYSPNTYNNAIYLKEGLKRLQSYLPQLQTLVSEYGNTYPHRVFMGDTEAFDYFKNNYLTDFTSEEGNAGTFYLHPNKKGTAKLGEFWGKAIYKVVKEIR
ncbi:MAG: GDSL-type esterase/lipase family protein [Bacteroides sp.]